MANVFFIGDLHAGHKNIANFRKQFSSEQEHWEFCKERYHSVVTKRDVVYCLGDMCFTEERLKEFSEWEGRKILICGNHDRDTISMSTIVQYYEEVHALLKYKKFWLSHCPIHQDELRGRNCIHGHMHDQTIDDDRYLNVCLEQINYTPISLLQVREIFAERENKKGSI